MNENSTTLWMKAASFAALQHRHQIRKDGKTPYIAHPFRVAMIVRDMFDVGDEEVLAAALLHDTIEDTTTDFDELKDEFGERVAEMVGALTKDMRLPNNLREVEYDRQLANGPWEARLIKIADVMDNFSDSSTHNQAKSCREKIMRILALTEGDDRLADAVEKLRLHCRDLMEEEKVL